MSYNCDSIEVLGKSTASMQMKDIRMLLADNPDNRPEICFLDDFANDAVPTKPLNSMTPAELRDHAEKIETNLSKTVAITRLGWCGEGSGHTFDYLKTTVVPLIRGHIEAVLIWEGGDSVSGIIINDGKLIECDVSYKLTPKKGKQ